jgi:hypothetical protein
MTEVFLKSSFFRWRRLSEVIFTNFLNDNFKMCRETFWVKEK